MQTALRSLVIGYGNPERCDDGVGFYVVNRLRRQLGHKLLGWNDNGISELGGRNDFVFIRQLVPELIETVADYHRVIFVDAHMPAVGPPLVCRQIDPLQSEPLLSHHMQPAQLLGILKAIYDREPVSHLLTIQGCSFEFSRGLSAGTAELVSPAAAMIIELLGPANLL